MFIFWQASYTG